MKNKKPHHLKYRLLKKHVNRRIKAMDLMYKRYLLCNKDWDRYNFLNGRFNIFQHIDMADRADYVVKVLKQEQKKSRLAKQPVPKRPGYYED